MTGYALAFPLNSKYKPMFDEKILELRENGELMIRIVTIFIIIVIVIRKTSIKRFE